MIKVLSFRFHWLSANVVKRSWFYSLNKFQKEEKKRKFQNMPFDLFSNVVEFIRLKIFEAFYSAKSKYFKS